MLRRFAFLGPLVLTGCAAQMIQSAGSGGSPYAPLNNGNRTGVVRYLIGDGDFFVNRRREDAYKKMYRSCVGPYVIVAEGEREENGRVVTAIVESAEAIAARRGDSTVARRGRGSVTKSSDTVETKSERTELTTQSVEADHYWYMEYRCATAADSGRVSRPR